MLYIRIHNNRNVVFEEIKKILAEFAIDYFSVVYSEHLKKCSELIGNFNEIVPFLHKRLIDLDSEQGYILKDGSNWDFVPWDKKDEENKNEIFVTKENGLVYLYNLAEINHKSFPIFVIKKDFYDIMNGKVKVKPTFGTDFTLSYSPAIFIRSFYQ